MLNEKLEKAINYQINRELYSEYLYLSMAAYLESQGFSGFANFMTVQAEEEHFHAMKFFRYVNERGSRVILGAIEKPPVDFESAMAVFTESLKHEQLVTDLINDLMDVAIEVKDHATKSFLNWYVDEQVEEEATFQELIDKMKMIGGQGHGMLMLNNELAMRTYTPPVV